MITAEPGSFTGDGDNLYRKIYLVLIFWHGIQEGFFNGEGVFCEILEECGICLSFPDISVDKRS